MAIIETNNLTKYYGKSRGIIDVNLEIEEGEIFGFIGPNGAGKTTTIRTLLAFIHPTGGSAKIFGMDCITRSHEIKKFVGYLPAEVNYYNDMRVKDLLNYSARLYKKDCEERTKELSEALGLELKMKINALSSGNKKKLAIVQAIMHKPKILILDEPTSGLDPLIQSEFFKIIKEENRKGVTIFFSSHVLSDVQKICDRVAIIRDGCLVEIEKIKELRSGKYKKIKIAFNNKVTEDIGIDIAGMKDIIIKDNVMEFIYFGKIGKIIQEIAHMGISDLWIGEPTLEEIFMHYYKKENNQYANLSKRNIKQ